MTLKDLYTTLLLKDVPGHEYRLWPNFSLRHEHAFFRALRVNLIGRHSGHKLALCGELGLQHE